MTQPSINDQITAFESQAASLLAGFATEASIGKAGLEDNLYAVGVSAKVTATGDAVKVEVQVPEHPGFKPSENPEDFTAEAQARRAEQYLAKRKSAVWTAIKRMSGITSEQKVAALRGLGYDAVNLPSQKTTVSATIANPTGDGYHGYSDVQFTLDGEHTLDEVRAQLETVVKDSPGTALVLAAFPDAVLPDSAGKVRNLSVYAELTWPKAYTA
jgi:hypothetical protein